MGQVKPLTFLAKKRSIIASRVRELRQQRKWQQAELARRLGLSQSRLSEIERGDGSFSAEQLLLILSLFNVPISEFSEESFEPEAELHNALARLGASHLYEAEHLLLSEKLADASNVIREALVSGSPRAVTGAASVLLLHEKTLNLRSIQVELTRLGYEHRLPWLIENTLEALEPQTTRLPRRLATAPAALRGFVDMWKTHTRLNREEPSLDILDPSIRTQKTVEAVRRASSDISRRWGIVSALTPEDFVEPVKVVLEAP